MSRINIAIPRWQGERELVELQLVALFYCENFSVWVYEGLLLTFRTLFYPALVFTFVDKRHGETVVGEEEVAGESTPLLRG